MQDDLGTLFDFSRWADETIVAAIRKLTPEQYQQEPAPGCPSTHTILVHMGDAALIWARRVAGETVTTRITEAEAPTLGAAVALLTRAHDALHQLLPTLSPERLSAPFTYQNLRGEMQSLPLWAVLRHLVNHGTYHRGQIAMNLMRFGHEPPLMDLALWAQRQALP